MKSTLSYEETMSKINNCHVREKRNSDGIIIGCYRGDGISTTDGFIACLNCGYIPCLYFEGHNIEKRRCAECGKVLDLSNFKYGRSRKCNECINGKKSVCYGRFCKEHYYKDCEDSRKRWAENTLKHHVRAGFDVRIPLTTMVAMAISSDVCALCGIELDYSYGKGQKINSPSLDRIENGSVLNPDNVQIICLPCNTGKGKFSEDSYIERCIRVAKLKHRHEKVTGR